jgi:hypothetical protein
VGDLDLMMGRAYRYVGPEVIAQRSTYSPLGTPVETVADVIRWIRHTCQQLDQSKSLIATFVVDDSGTLRIADRRSEHVACAGGQAVQSAGEITFTVVGSNVTVAEVTNQSTGYCPEPDSWPAVKADLERAGLTAPDAFAREFVFRRCARCDTINIIKDEVFECAVCWCSLPLGWNCVPRGPN